MTALPVVRDSKVFKARLERMARRGRKDCRAYKASKALLELMVLGTS